MVHSILPFLIVPSASFLNITSALFRSIASEAHQERNLHRQCLSYSDLFKYSRGFKNYFSADDVIFFVFYYSPVEDKSRSLFS